MNIINLIKLFCGNYYKNNFRKGVMVNINENVIYLKTQYLAKDGYHTTGLPYYILERTLEFSKIIDHIKKCIDCSSDNYKKIRRDNLTNFNKEVLRKSKFKSQLCFDKHSSLFFINIKGKYYELVPYKFIHNKTYYHVQNDEIEKIKIPVSINDEEFYNTIIDFHNKICKK